MFEHGVFFVNRRPLLYWTLVPSILASSFAVALPANTKQEMAMPSHSLAPSATSTPLALPAGAVVDPWESAFIALAIAMIAAYFFLKRDRRPIALVLAAATLLSIVVLAIAQVRYGAVPMDAGMTQVRGNAPTPVTLAVIRGGLADPTIVAPANVEPYFNQNIVARAPGLLTGLTAYTGDRVGAGQTVARLEEPELQSNAAAAQADVESQQAELQSSREQVRYWDAEISRERFLLDRGAVSIREYQNERAQASAARSAYAAAQAKLASAQFTAQSQNVMAGYTNVVAPNDAVVVKRLVDPGVFVQAGTPILQVAVLDRVRVQVQVAQSAIGSVHVGSRIDVRFDDGTLLRGHISSITPVAASASHTILAEAIVPNPGKRLQPGGFARASIHTSAAMPANAVTVASGAIVGGVTTAVWVSLEGRAHRVPVTVISDDGTTAWIAGRDVRPGTRVVVAGSGSLQEGQPIVSATP